MDFNWEALEGQNRRLADLRRKMADWAPAAETLSPTADDADRRFREALADDLDLPRALVVLNEVVGGDLAPGERYALLARWDAVLALDLEHDAREGWEPTEEIRALVAERDTARGSKDYARSDELRDRLQVMGLEVMDTPEGTKVRPHV
jgi:cysteinyl-tRNA synthetase